jgi:hypothetical protein
LIANEFIKKINAQYGAQIPLVSVPAVPGIPIGKTSLESGAPPSATKTADKKGGDYQGWKDFLELMGGLPASGHSN